MFTGSKWYLKSNSITGGGLFLIIEVFQLVSEKGVIELDYLISKLLNKASLDISMTVQKSNYHYEQNQIHSLSIGILNSTLLPTWSLLK